MNNGEKEDITFKVAEVETWLKDKGATCSSIKLDKINGIDMIATFNAQKPLSEIIGLLQERPDVAMQSTSNTKDGWLVHIKVSARQQKVKVLFNLDWNDVIRQAMPTLSVIAMALFLILAANTCDSLMSISRSVAKVVSTSDRIERGIKETVPSMVKELKNKSPLPSAFPLVPMHTMTFPEEKGDVMQDSGKDTPSSDASRPTAVIPPKENVTDKVEPKQPSALQQDNNKANNQKGIMSDAVMRAIEDAINNAASAQNKSDVLVIPPDILQTNKASGNENVISTDDSTLIKAEG